MLSFFVEVTYKIKEKTQRKTKKAPNKISFYTFLSGASQFCNIWTNYRENNRI